MSPNALRFMHALHTYGWVSDWTAAPDIKLIGVQVGLSEPQAIAAAIELERLRLASMNLHLHIRLTPDGKNWCATYGVAQMAPVVESP